MHVAFTFALLPFTWGQEIVTSVRQFRADFGISPKTPIPTVFVVDSELRAACQFRDAIADLGWVEPMANIGAILYETDIREIQNPFELVTLTLSYATVALSTFGVLPLPTIKDKLSKRLNTERTALDRLRQRCQNPGYLAKVSHSAKQADQEKLIQLEQTVKTIENNLNNLEAPK